MSNTQLKSGDELDAILYRFADYIRHHERTGLGGPDNQQAIKNELQAREREVEERGRIDELEMALSVVGVTYVRGTPVRNLEGAENKLDPEMIRARLESLRKGQ